MFVTILARMIISTPHTGCGARTRTEKKMCPILQKATFQIRKFSQLTAGLKMKLQMRTKQNIQDSHMCGKTKTFNADMKHASAVVMKKSYLANFPITDS